MSQSNISLAQQAIDMDVAYVDAEKEWKVRITVWRNRFNEVHSSV